MNKIDIDFDAANMISDYILDDVDMVDNIMTSSSNAIAPIRNLPSNFFGSTCSKHDEMNKSIANVDKLFNAFSFAFDSSVNSYYCEENDIEQEVVDYDANSQTRRSTGFVWGYKAGSPIRRVNPQEMASYLQARGAKQVAPGIYELNIDGETYRYNVNDRRMTIGNNKTSYKCDFYVAKDHKDGPVSSTVTLLGGTNERYSGPVAQGKLSDNISLDKNALLIIPYKGDYNNKLTGYDVITSNKFGEKVFGTTGDVTRSIAGCSEGAQIASITVSENPGVYDNVVFINGGTRYDSDPNYSSVKPGGFEGFKDTNVVYIITRKGWNINSTVASINDMIANGVNPNNITLITNDSNLSNSVNQSINFVNAMPEASGNLYNGHGSGSWDVLNKSEIINYLSML